MKPALRELAWAHIFELGEQHGVRVRYAKSWSSAESHAGTRQVWVPPKMHRPAAYLVALHEFGHVCSAPARKRNNAVDTPGRFGDELACEAFAWSWAVDHALPALLAAARAADWARVGECMSSYALERSKQRVAAMK